MTTINFNRSLTEIIEHFENAENHLDGNLTHVSMEELSAAVGEISYDADLVLESMIDPSTRIFVRNDIYRDMRRLQTEGRKNDPNLSMRDLYAFRRGTGYFGEPLPFLEELKAKIEENAIDYNDVTTIYEQRTYVVTHVTTTVVSCTIGDINTVCPQTSIESEIVDKAEYDSHSGSKHINKRYYLALNSGETTEVSEGRFLRAIDHLTYVTNNNFSAFEDDEGLVTYSGHMDAGEELATSGIEEN